LLVFIPPIFKYDGSAPPWDSVHLDYVVPPHKPTLAELETESDATPEEKAKKAQEKKEEQAKVQFDSPKGVHVSANPHNFDPVTYTMGIKKFTPVQHLGMPKAPQPRPVPLPNAHLYSNEFHTLAELRSYVQRVPPILRKMSAKTGPGQGRFHERQESAYRQRKMLYAAGEQLLREGFEGDYQDRRDHCGRCGSSFFEHKGGKLRCRDCRWEKYEATYVDRRDRFDTEAADRALVDSYGSASMSHTFESQRETTGKRQNDHQERKVWFSKWQARWNPTSKPWKDATPKDIQLIQLDPDFPIEVVRNEVMFHGKYAVELAGGKPNTLTKKLSRTHNQPTWFEANFGMKNLDNNKAGDQTIIIILDGVPHPKSVGKVTDPAKSRLRTLLRHHKATEKNTLKSLRKGARKHGWTTEMLATERLEAKKRVAAAYQLAEDALIEEVEQEEGHDVTLFHTIEGR
jgi:hypothetical protein